MKENGNQYQVQICQCVSIVKVNQVARMWTAFKSVTQDQKDIENFSPPYEHLKWVTWGQKLELPVV